MADSTSVADAATVPSAAQLERAEKFTREPFVLRRRGSRDRARRRVRRAGARSTPRWPSSRAAQRCPSIEWQPPLFAAARARAPAVRGGAAPRRRHAAHRPPGRRAVGHADRAAGRGPAHTATARWPRPRRPSWRSTTRKRRLGLGREPTDDEEPDAEAEAGAEPDDEDDDEDDDELDSEFEGDAELESAAAPEVDEDDDELDEIEAEVEVEDDEPVEDMPPDDEDEDDEPEVDEDVVEGAAEDPNAVKRFWFEHATGAGKTVAAMGFVEASRTGGVLILTHRRNLVDQFHGELRDRGYAKRITPALLDDATTRATAPSRSRPTSGSCATPGASRRLHDRHLRRGPHRAGREDVGRDPRVDRPDLRRHDRDRRADRPPRHRPVPDPDLALRPRPGRAARRDRAAALHAHPARAGRADDRQGAAAPRRGRRRVRPGDAGRAARPDAVQLRDRRPLQDALQRRARRRLRGRRPPRLQRRRGVPRPGHQGRSGVGRDAQATSWPRSSPATSAATSTCSSTRSCWPRAGTHRARRSACTWRRPRPSASTSSASAASRAATRARRRASSSTSSIPPTRTTTRS